MVGAETVVHGSLKEIGSIYFLSLQALNVTTATVEDMYRETVELDAVTAPLLGKMISSKGTIIELDMDYTAGQRALFGVQNLFFGLGSYKAGYKGDGIFLTVSHILAWSTVLSGVIFWGVESSAGIRIEKGIGIPIVLSGIGAFSVFALYGFIRPIFYHKPGTEVGAFGEPDGLRLAIIPFGDNPVMQVSYRKSL